MNNRMKRAVKRNLRKGQVSHGYNETLSGSPALPTDTASATDKASVTLERAIAYCDEMAGIAFSDPEGTPDAVAMNRWQTLANMLEGLKPIANAHDALVDALHKAETELEIMESATGTKVEESVILAIRAALKLAQGE